MSKELLNIDVKLVDPKSFYFYQSEVGFLFAFKKDYMDSLDESFELTLPTREKISSEDMVPFDFEKVNVNDYQFYETVSGFQGAVDGSFLTQCDAACVFVLPNGEGYDNFLADGFTMTDPGTYQYGLQLSDTKFQFYEFGQNNDHCNESIIDLEKYSREEILHKVSGHHEKEEIIEMIDNGLQDDNNWILAECIFEYECY